MGLFSFLREKFSKKPRDERQDSYEKGLRKSRAAFADRLKELSKRYGKASGAYFEELEEILIEADVGVSLTLRLVQGLMEKARKEGIEDTTRLNEELVEFPEEVADRTEAINYRLEHAGLTRKIGTNQVRVIRVMLTGSHDAMKRIEEEGRLPEWCVDNLAWLRETFGAEVKAWFSEILVADAGTLDLPAPVIASEDAAYLIANDGYSPVLSVMGITQDEVDGYIDDLVEAGLVDTGLAGLFTGGYACLADEVSDIVLILYYDAASETLTICSDALTYFYKWDGSYVASLLYYCYIEDTVTLPAIDGYCYVDESMLDYYGMFGIYAPGDITGTYGEALTAAGWTYDADIEMWSNESAGLFLEYDAEADITSITIIGPYGI